MKHGDIVSLRGVGTHSNCYGTIVSMTTFGVTNMVATCSKPDCVFVSYGREFPDVIERELLTIVVGEELLALTLADGIRCVCKDKI